MVSKTQSVLRLSLPLALFLCGAAATNLHAEETPLDKQAKYAAAVADLHHPDFRTRQQAYKTLAEAGAAAVPAIEAGAREANRETRDRAISLLLGAALSRQKEVPQAGTRALEQLAAAKEESLKRAARTALEELKGAKVVRAIDRISELGGTVTSATGVDLELQGPFATPGQAGTKVWHSLPI